MYFRKVPGSRGNGDNEEPRKGWDSDSDLGTVLFGAEVQGKEKRRLRNI